MTSYKRADRVADLIRSEISDICIKQLRDPRVGMITITDVKVSSDLKVAKIYFVKMGQDICDADTKTGLEKAKGFIRRELGQRIELRTVPELIFLYDQSFAYGDRIERLIQKLHAGETQDAK